MSEPSEASAIQQLQEWYVRNCNGEWEHSYGVRIDTLDNPGWKVAIDLAGTPWASLVSPTRNIERSETDWIHTKIEATRFVGFGGPRNLEEIIHEFFRRLDQNRRT